MFYSTTPGCFNTKHPQGIKEGGKSLIQEKRKRERGEGRKEEEGKKRILLKKGREEGGGNE